MKNSIKNFDSISEINFNSDFNSLNGDEPFHVDAVENPKFTLSSTVDRQSGKKLTHNDGSQIIYSKTD